MMRFLIGMDDAMDRVTVYQGVKSPANRQERNNARLQFAAGR